MDTLDIKPKSTDVTHLPTLLFAVGKNVYGINSQYVHGIETMSDYTTIVDSDPHMRGGVFYQEQFIPLIDMRKLFGLDTQVDEFEKSVQPERRIHEHESWVDALELSVREGTEFRLADDPHQCAFGRWYYAFGTDNNVLKHQLSAIEAPHEEVHKTAKTVKRLMRDNRREEAMDAIREMKETHFQTTLTILSSLRSIMESSLKELYIVISTDAGLKGLIVDSIVGVEDLDHTLPLPESIAGPVYLECLGRRKKGGAVVSILNNAI